MTRITTDEPRLLTTDDGFKFLPPRRQASWFGFLQTHRELMRVLDQELASRHRLSLSAYELLNRLAHAENGSLRTTKLAEQATLSVSRVSRLIDQLALAGWVERRNCAEDSRVVHVTLTESGRDLVRAAQETFFEVVEERWFANLSPEEVRLLADIFERMDSAGGAGCATALSAADGTD